MSRSRNSRKGKKGSRSHSARHHCCHDGKGCSYCQRNFKIAELKQKQMGSEKVGPLTCDLKERNEKPLDF